MSGTGHPARAPALRIDVVSDLVCPWCHIGRAQLDAAPWDAAERRRVVAEVGEAFELNIAMFTELADAAGIDCLLVGDSVGMVCQGLASTVGVTLETMRHHTQCVARGLERAQGGAWLVADLPFGSYQASPRQAVRSAARLMKAGAAAVKLEGGERGADAIAMQMLL